MTRSPSLADTTRTPLIKMSSTPSTRQPTFVSRIKGNRDVHHLSLEQFRTTVTSRKCTPAFTLQEHFSGAVKVCAYYDWDAKYDEEPATNETQRQFVDFKACLVQLHGDEIRAGRTFFAARHGRVTKDGKEQYKISYRAWLPWVQIDLGNFTAAVRSVLGLGAREAHSHLDLSVYKSREQLLGCIGGTKDIDTLKRYLVPVDVDGEDLSWDDVDPADYLAQNVRHDAVVFSPGQTAGAAGAMVKGKRARKGKARADTEADEGGPSNAGPSEKTTFTRADADAKDALVSATDYFGDKYRLQEDLEVVTVDRKGRNMVFQTRLRWCYLKKGRHARNNPYIALSEQGARFKCPDEECKALGDLPHIPLTQLPAPLRDFFTKVCYEHVNKELMIEATEECQKNITTNFPEEEGTETSPFSNMLTTIAHHQTCKKCRSGRMQFEHALYGWHLRCMDCNQPWPSHPVPLPENDFPKLFAALTQLNVSIGNLTVNNNYVLTAEEPFVGSYDEDGLVVFDDPEKNSALLSALQGTDIALSAFVFIMFHDEFHCCKGGTKGTEGMWYHFFQHRWVGKAELTLRQKLGENDHFLRYIKTALYFYERDRIQTDDTKRKARHIKRVIEQLGDNGRRKRILEDAIERFHVHRPNFAEELDTANMLAFTNGVYDFTEFQFRDGRPEDLLSTALKIPYQPYDQQSADCQTVMQFMSAIQPDEATRDYLLTLLSLCTTTDTTAQHFWIFTGEGANGKSKLMNFLMETLGDHYGTAPAALLTRRREDANQANEALSALEKVRVAVFSEGSAAEILQVNTIKLFTGEDVITTRGLHEKQRRWKPAFKCILVCNDIPKLDENSWAAWRRFKVIHFPTSFVDNPIRPHERQKDPRVGEILKRCVCAFIAILIEYYRRFKTAGLVESEAIMEATRKYQTENDLFEEFYQAFIVEEHGAALKLVDLRTAFLKWLASAHRKRNPPSTKALDQIFVSKLGIIYKNQFEGTWLTGWRHYRLEK